MTAGRREELPLEMLLRRIREGLNDPATNGPPEAEMGLELTRREWKQIRDNLVHLGAIGALRNGP